LFLADVYITYFKNSVDSLSLLGVIVLLHTTIGEAQRIGKTLSHLLEDGITTRVYMTYLTKM
jgi:hypothetical protein